MKKTEMQKGKKGRRNRNLPLDLPVLLLGLLITAGVCGYFAWSGSQENKKEALHIAEVYAARTGSLMERLFHKTDVLESIIISNGGEITESTFEDLAKSLLDGEGIRAIQYLPQGKVTYCYPREGNEEAIGDNVFQNEKRKQDAWLAVNTKSIVFSGPYVLSQGGIGLVARNPIFLTNPEGEEQFWGFAAIILKMPEALGPIGLEELVNNGYQFNLHSVLEDGKDVQIAGTEEFSGYGAVEGEILVPHHVWKLDIARKYGWIRWKEFLIFLGIGIAVSLLCANSVFHLHEKKELFHYFAIRDELTGLLNRRGLVEIIELWCKETERPFFLFYMDLNYFKKINDTYGHNAGDRLLKETAVRLETSLAQAVCGRMGGDEFLALIPGRKEEGDTYLDMIREAMKPPVRLGGAEMPISISIGYSCFPAEGTSYDELSGKADERMYQNKKEMKKG